VSTVDSYLHQKGLPTELILEVLSLTDYSWKRRTPIADDPLHPDNSHELRKYLNYCWKLLMRCDLLAKETGNCIDWETEVTDCIWDLWGELPWKMVQRDDGEERYRRLFGDFLNRPLETRHGYSFLVDDSKSEASRKLSFKWSYGPSSFGPF
jgi:hypothetical protein